MHPDPAPDDADLIAGPFTTRRGLTTLPRAELRSDRYVRLTRGAYASAGTPRDHGLEIRAATLVLPADTVIGGRSAAWWHGVRGIGPTSRVEAFLPPDHHVRHRGEIRARRVDLREGEHGVIDGVRVTTPARTAFDVGRSGHLDRTVPVLDALLACTGTTVAEVAAIRRAHPGARSCRTLDRALELVDPAAESPAESALRVLLVTAGLPRPAVNHRVLDGDVFVARVDLAWPDLRVGVEYDGAHHDDPSRVAADRRRLNMLKALGWTVLVVDRHQMRRPDDVVHLVATVLRQAARDRRA